MSESSGALTESDLIAIYRDLHAHPELGFAETRTAALVAERLRGWGYEVHTGVGGTGVVGILENGPGPTAYVRADMDGLPVLEETGLEYASRARGTDASGKDVPVMHACGHDVHVTCLLGAASAWAADRSSFAGRLVLVFQPAEELGAGAEAMVADGLYDKAGKPDVVLGQHVGPFPAGLLLLHPGTAMAASDTLVVTMYGAGGHGSRPESTIDPVMMVASTIVRLQTIISRETAFDETAVLTIGMVHAGTAPNIIPDDAEFQINIRTTDPAVRERTLAAVDRIVHAEAQASGATRPPTIDHAAHFAALVNDPEASARTQEAFEAAFGQGTVVDPGAIAGSEDVGVLATSAGVPCVYWFIGGADPALYAGAASLDDVREVLRTIPSNHSPQYAPMETPTLALGVKALQTAVRTWLPVG